MNSLPLQKGAGVWLNGMIVTVALLAAAWLLAGTVAAQSAPTIEIERTPTSLSASATAAEGGEINGYSWKWIVSDECSADIFSDFNALENEKGTGWIASLDADSGDKRYCFYVEDVEGHSAVASVVVASPAIELEQNNDQLTARVGNVDEDSLTIAAASWRWYRYSHVEGSGFGCESQFFGLKDSELAEMVAADVYEAQRDVYMTGSGSSVSLTDDEEGLNYCFGVSDESGVSDVGRITVGEVVISDVTGEKSSVGADSQSPASEEVGMPGAGEVSTEDGAQNGSDDNNGDGDSNTIRNIGFVLLAISLILGVWMVIKRSQNTDDEEEEL